MKDYEKGEKMGRKRKVNNEERTVYPLQLRIPPMPSKSNGAQLPLAYHPGGCKNAIAHRVLGHDPPGSAHFTSEEMELLGGKVTEEITRSRVCHGPV